MSWESTLPYYETINRVVSQRLGGLHSAEILLRSIDFHPIEVLQRGGKWAEAGEILAKEAHGIQQAGADFLVLCTNTMHKVLPRIESAVEIPILHIADATSKRIDLAGLTRLALLGTRYTMEDDFYRERLVEFSGFQVLIPTEEEREIVHNIIYEELCHGLVLETSRRAYVEITSALVSRGAEGIILGCTEIGMILKEIDSEVPLFDTAQIHAEEAAIFALDGD